MRTKILTLGLICLFIFVYCQKDINNPHSNNPYELFENSEEKLTKHANLEITIIPEIPIFTYCPNSDTSKTAFTLVLTETNGVVGYIKPTFHFWVVNGMGCKSHYYLPTTDFDRYGTISFDCPQVGMRCRPTNMALCLEGFDTGGFQVSIRVNLPFTWDSE